MAGYQSLLHIVAENPGATAGKITSTATVDNTKELLDRAEASNDIVCVNDRYWVVRKGEFAFEEYDHPKTDLSE